MTPEQIEALGPAFSEFLRQFQGAFVQQRTRKHLETYARGLMSDLQRKSVEPMALEAGTAVRTLQEFLSQHVWDEDQLRDQLQRHVAGWLASHADEVETVGLVDETSCVKKGKKSPGVQRQWCGEVGKKENCVVTVHLGVVAGTFKTLLDSDLFLPQSWSDDRPRCQEAGIPEHVVYQPKWQIALAQIDRARANGLHFDWLTFDEHYGSKPEFLFALEERGVRWVAEVPRSFSCLTSRPRGRPPHGGWKGKRADHLARYSPHLVRQQWRSVRLSRLTLADQRWEVRSGQVYLLRQGQLRPRTYWLIVARNVSTGEVKYFVSNAPAKTALKRLLAVAFRRWNVEHSFRVCKSELGFGHYEGRHYRAHRRHLLLCLLVMGFVAEHTQRLRGEKSGDHPGAGVSGVEPAVSRLAVELSRPPGLPFPLAGDPVSPAPQPCRSPLPPARPPCEKVAL